MRDAGGEQGGEGAAPGAQDRIVGVGGIERDPPAEASTVATAAPRM